MNLMELDNFSMVRLKLLSMDMSVMYIRFYDPIFYKNSN
jgi:hypothetical protein